MSLSYVEIGLFFIITRLVELLTRKTPKVRWFFYYPLSIAYLLSTGISNLPESRHGPLAGEFNSVRCAELHNRLVSKVSGPAAHQLTPFLELHAGTTMGGLPFQEFLSPPFLDFLYRIRVPQNSSFGLTPFLEHPTLDHFWDFRTLDVEDVRPHTLLLYPSIVEGSEIPDGGLFFDMKTNLVSMIHIPPNSDSLVWPEAKYWFPLETALKKYTKLFENGRYNFTTDSETNKPALIAEHYTEKDVEEALNAYSALLAAISSRIPKTATSGEKKLMVSTDVLDTFGIGGFSYQFLSRAQAPPGFSYIAPGIRAFTDESLTQLMQQDTSPINPDVEHIPMLVFPGDSPISDASLDGSGLNGLLIDNTTGVYLVGGGDEMELVLPSPVSVQKKTGNHLLYQHAPNTKTCPLLPPHSTRLVSLLKSWTCSVQTGMWSVGPEGVEGGMEWYLANQDQSRWNNCQVGTCW